MVSAWATIFQELEGFNSWILWSKFISKLSTQFIVNDGKKGFQLVKENWLGTAGWYANSGQPASQPARSHSDPYRVPRTQQEKWRELGTHCLPDCSQLSFTEGVPASGPCVAERRSPEILLPGTVNTFFGQIKWLDLQIRVLTLALLDLVILIVFVLKK